MESTKIIKVDFGMSFGVKEARTFLAMYRISKDTNHLKSALNSDYNYTIMYSMDNGLYWILQGIINNKKAA